MIVFSVVYGEFNYYKSELMLEQMKNIEWKKKLLYKHHL